MRLVVGLGNPGSQYEKTRHNVGFWLVNALAEKCNDSFKHEPKLKGLLSTVNISKHECKLFMPMTFMNLSGEAVRKIVSFYKIPIESILVIHDELDFLPGVVRLKKGGGANGHNGVQNIIDHLGSNNFWRLRIGIGKPSFKEDMVNYVTSSPNKSETKQIHNAIDQAIKIIPDLILGNFAKAMQDLHSCPS
ncbi:peptidyl-tRNA hydrolase [Gammaproteobacteria bacterium]